MATLESAELLFYLVRFKYDHSDSNICIGGMLVVVSLLMFIFADNFIGLIASVPPLAILSIILANTWAKK